MFKQTSNYLNSIWDLRGVPALRKYRHLLPPPSLLRLSGIFRLSPPLAASGFVCLFSSRFWGPEDVVRVHVKSTRHAFHSLPMCVLSLSPLYPADIPTDNPFRLFLASSCSLVESPRSSPSRNYVGLHSRREFATIFTHRK